MNFRIFFDPQNRNLSTPKSNIFPQVWTIFVSRIFGPKWSPYVAEYIIWIMEIWYIIKIYKKQIELFETTTTTKHVQTKITFWIFFESLINILYNERQGFGAEAPKPRRRMRVATPLVGAYISRIILLHFPPRALALQNLGNWIRSKQEPVLRFKI